MADRRVVEAASIPPSFAADPNGRGHRRPQLGALLLRDGVITAEQLAAALAQKEVEGGRLREILLRHNMATAAAIARALGEQYGLEFVELARLELEPAATGTATSVHCRRSRTRSRTRSPDSRRSRSTSAPASHSRAVCGRCSVPTRTSS